MSRQTNQPTNVAIARGMSALCNAVAYLREVHDATGDKRIERALALIMQGANAIPSEHYAVMLRANHIGMPEVLRALHLPSAPHTGGNNRFKSALERNVTVAVEGGAA